MQNSSILQNRLIKNKKKLKSYLKRNNISCFRLYDKDIPEYPYIIDIYDESALIYEKGKRLSEDEQILRNEHLNDAKEALINGLNIKEENIILKIREKKQGANQYTKLDKTSKKVVVKESGLRFLVNFHDYLDTGLFLDHRPLRNEIREIAQNKKVLNLFAYTGSISIYAASGGARVTTVDLSKTYISWAQENFQLNDFKNIDHDFIVSDVFEYLKECSKGFDIIIIDPPSFSNSKKIDSIFDVQRDHRGLIELAAKRLNKDGVIYFSNNFRKFKIDEEILSSFKVKDISFQSIPEDFRDKKIHQCFKIEAKS